MELARDAIPTLDAAGVRLVVVSIGTLERAKDFSRENDFPIELLYADAESATYEALKLRKGAKQTFMEKSTPESILKRWNKDGAKDLLGVLKRWKPWLPPRPDQGYQQGGSFVFRDGVATYVSYDVSTGAHAPLDDIFEAAGVSTSKLVARVIDALFSSRESRARVLVTSPRPSGFGPRRDRYDAFANPREETRV